MVFEEQLLSALENLGTVTVTQRVWRTTFEGQPVLRPNVRGARWNPPDTAALYAAMDEATTRAEWEYLLASQPLRPRTPSVVSLLDVHLMSVVDLSDLRVIRREFDIDLLRLPDTVYGYQPCQDIGGGAAFLGRSGLLVPSLRRSSGTNLVIFPVNVSAGTERYEIVAGDS
jgi:RES domain-containing protein